MEQQKKLEYLNKYHNMIVKNAYAHIKYVNSYVDVNDLIVEIQTSLYYALDKMDSNISESAYIKKCILNAIGNFKINYSRQKRRSADESLNVEIFNDGEDKRTLEDTIENGINIEYDIMNKLLLEDIDEYFSNILPQNQYDMYKMYFFEGYTYKEIGEKYGISKQRVNIIITRAIKKAQKEFC